MKRSLHGCKTGSLLPLIPLALFSAPLSVKAAFIAGLDGVNPSSTFSGQGVTPIGAGLLGWSDVLGGGRFFEAGGDGSMIGLTPYDNYTVRYNPAAPVALLPNTQYSLTFNMGYVAGNTGGNSGYEFSIGTVITGVYTPLTNITGTSPYPGNMHSVSSAVDTVTLNYTTGGVVAPGNLALQWAQTSTNGVPNSSDFFGFNLVTLDATTVPEPSAAIFAVAALAALSSRRRRVHVVA